MLKKILLFLFFILPITCLAQPLSSTELINNAKSCDGRIVSYEGEVIGDVMKRATGAWININDGENAIGIWGSSSLAKDIIYTGSHKSFGDKVEVTGIFHRACPEHGGDLDIHAQSLRKINSGRSKQERLNPDKRNQVIILSGVLILIWILSLLKRK